LEIIVLEGLLNHPLFTGKSIIPVSRIPVSRITEKYIPLRKYPHLQDGSMGLTTDHPKIILTHGDDYPTLSLG
jgi:hypothetical protein